MAEQITRHIWGTWVLGVLVLGSSGAVAQDKPAFEAKSIRPAELDADLICATEKWAVWRTEKLDESTFNFRVQTYAYRFYRQRLTDPDATFLGTLQDTNSGMQGTVLEDGTFVLGTRGQIMWYVAGKAPIVEKEPHGFLLTVYQDGVLYHTHSSYSGTDRVSSPIAFIPFKDRRLDVNAQMQVAPKGDKEFGFFDPFRGVARYKNEFAILVLHADGEVNPGRWRSSLQVFNLESKKHRTLPLAVTLKGQYNATAFNDEFLAADRRERIALDLKTMKDTEFPPFDAPRIQSSGIFAIRHGIGYFTLDKVLYATDLTDKNAPTIGLAVNLKQEECPQTDKGLIVWKGKTWETIPWLERWPMK